MMHVIHQVMTSVREHEASIQQLMTSVREHEARYSATNDFCKGT